MRTISLLQGAVVDYVGIIMKQLMVKLMLVCKVRDVYAMFISELVLDFVVAAFQSKSKLCASSATGHFRYSLHVHVFTVKARKWADRAGACKKGVWSPAPVKKFCFCLKIAY
jgi:hypothetical protein